MGSSGCGVPTRCPRGGVSASVWAIGVWSHEHGPVDWSAGRNYSYYMKPVELKVARIGNSRGVRLPAPTLERYRIGATVVMEERSDGILLRPPGSVSPKLSWEETAR